MKSTPCFIPLRLLLFISCIVYLPAVHAGEIQALSKSKVVEIINDVSIFTGDDLEPKPAVENMIFQAPDLLQTGRRSRARLEAEDGTITRVGSNTLFSFDESSRTINLRKGSVLFHSPEGKGGGRVVTASATASVLGTTIIVAATSNGGFKLLVLEGTAQVVFPDGSMQILGAGQMTFVLPKGTTASGKKTTNSKQAKSEEEPTQAGEAQPNNEGSATASDGGDTKTSPSKTDKLAMKSELTAVTEESGDVGSSGNSANTTERSSKPGPVLNFDLSRMKKGADLLNGFSVPIESEGKIEVAINEQGRLIKKGALENTDALIVETDGDETLVLAFENNDTRNTNQETSESAVVTRLREALDSNVSPQTMAEPRKNFFDYPGVAVPRSHLAASRFEQDELLYGFMASQMDFIEGSFNLAPFSLSGGLSDHSNDIGDNSDSTQDSDFFAKFDDESSFWFPPDADSTASTFDSLSHGNRYFFGALKSISFSGQLNLLGLTEDSAVEFATLGRLLFASGISVKVMDGETFTGEAVLSFNTEGTADLVFNDIDLINEYGELRVDAENAPIRILNGSVFSAGLSESEAFDFTSAPGSNDTELSVYGGSILVSASNLKSSGSVSLNTNGLLRVTDSKIKAGFIELYAKGDLYVDGTATELVSRRQLLRAEGDINLTSNGSSRAQDGLGVYSNKSIKVQGYSLKVDRGIDPSLIDSSTIDSPSTDFTSINSPSTDVTSAADTTSYSRLALRALNQVTVASSTIEAPHIFITAGNNINITGTSFNVDKLEIISGAVANLSNLNLSNLTEINIGAQTLILSDINFPDLGVGGIRLGSRAGTLAAAPNTEAAPSPGQVNFFKNVFFDGNPAQEYVSHEVWADKDNQVDAGTNSNADSKIQLYTK